MSTQIQIQRSTHATNAPTLQYGELGYSTRNTSNAAGATGQDVTNATGGYLYIGDNNSTGSNLRIIGGDHYVRMMNHTAGDLAASSAIITDANSKVDQFKTANVTVGGSALTFGAASCLELADGSTTSFSIKQGSNTYMTVDTTNDLISFGKPLSGTVSVVDGSATALSFKDNAGTPNNYLVLDTANNKVCIGQTLDIGANTLSMSGDITAGSAEFCENDATVTIKNAQDENTEGGRETQLFFKDHDGNEMAKIRAEHDGTSDDGKGNLKIYTGSDTGTGNKTATLALEVTSAQKSIFSGNVDVGTETSAKDLTVWGDMTVVGTTTTVNSTTVQVDDKNLELGGQLTLVSATPSPSAAWQASQTHSEVYQTSTDGSGTGLRVSITTDGSGNPTITILTDGTGYASGDTVTFTDPHAGTSSTATITLAAPTDATASGGGLTLKGATNKTLQWEDATDAWTSNQKFNLSTVSEDYRIANVSVLSNDTLGANIANSSLTNVGTLTALTVSGATVLNGGLTMDTNKFTVANDSGNTLVGGTLDVTGAVNLNATTASTSTTTGALIVDGGAGIAGNAHIGGSLDVANAVNLNNTTQSTSTTTGSLIVDGGAGIAKNAHVGGTLDVAGAVNFNATTTSTNTTSGALIVDGGAGIAENLNVGGVLNAAGLASLDGGIDVDGAFTVANTSGNVSTSGTLAAGNTTITGTLGVTSTSALQDDVTIYKASDNGDPSISLGKDANERFQIISDYGSADNVQKLDSVQFKTFSTSQTSGSDTGNAGRMSFHIDGSQILTIQDGGILGYWTQDGSGNFTTSYSNPDASGRTSGMPYLDGVTVDGGVWT